MSPRALSPELKRICPAYIGSAGTVGLRLIECRPVGVGVRSQLVGHALGTDQHRAGLNIVINLPRALVADQ